MTPEQLSFDLPSVPAQGRTDFLITPSNALALAQIDQWPDWPGGKLVLIGPEGSGKSHLTRVWAERSGGLVLSHQAIGEVTKDGILPHPHIAVEDLPQWAGQPEAEAALFHLHNMVLADGGTLLLTGRGEPALWGIALPDLKSRVQGTGVAELSPPDDALLGAVLGKLFTDRQLKPRTDVIPYLVDHMERSFAAASRIVAELDHICLTTQKPITRPMAARVLKADDASSRGAFTEPSTPR